MHFQDIFVMLPSHVAKDVTLSLISRHKAYNEHMYRHYKSFNFNVDFDLKEERAEIIKAIYLFYISAILTEIY